MSQQPPYYPPPPPRRSHTNAIIIGEAVVLIAVIVGTGIFVVQSRDDGDGGSAAPTVSATVESASVSPECRTWIKAELLDKSETVDATPGFEACGDLSEDELQAAIDEVAAELTAEITPQAP